MWQSESEWRMGDEGGWWTVNEDRLGGCPSSGGLEIALRWRSSLLSTRTKKATGYTGRVPPLSRNPCPCAADCRQLQTDCTQRPESSGEGGGVRMGKRCVFASRWSRDRNPLFGPRGPRRLSDFSANSIYFAINRRSKDMPVTVVRHGFNALDLEHKEGPGGRHSRWGRVWAR